MTDDRKWFCSIRDGRFVDPCWPLEENVHNHAPGFIKAKGIGEWSLTNITTHKPSRRYYGVLTRANPTGFLFNFCPFCGTDISAPFKDKEGAE